MTETPGLYRRQSPGVIWSDLVFNHCFMMIFCAIT